MALPSLALLPLGAPTGRRPIVSYGNNSPSRKPSNAKEDCDCSGTTRPTPPAAKAPKPAAPAPAARPSPPPAPAAAPATQLTDREQRDRARQIKLYLLDNYDVFSNASPRPGDRVFDSSLGRAGTVGKGGKIKNGVFHPTVVYDDTPGVEDRSHGERQLKVVKSGKVLPRFSWA